MRAGISLLAVLLGLASSASHASSPAPSAAAFDPADESASQRAIGDRTRLAIAAEDFAALDKLEAEFRTSRARTPSGLWNLAVFHSVLQSALSQGLRREDGCQFRKAPVLERWAKANRRSPAQAITRAALLLAQGWCFRGDGYASTVNEQDWPKFGSALAESAKSLDAAEGWASADPEFYAVKVSLLRAQGASESDFQQTFDQAVAREPDYHRTYFNAAWYYLPQWNGSYAQVEAFARAAASRTRSEEGEGLYARIYWSLEECGCRIIEQSADRAELRAAMRDVYNRYPVAWNGRYFAGIACRLGDADEGRAYIRAIHPEVSGEGDLAALFAGCERAAHPPVPINRIG